MLSDAKDKLSDAKDTVTEAISSATEAGRSAAQTVVHRATDITQRAQHGAADIFSREPLVLAALGLVVGIAIGAALPPTDTEDHLVGRLRDKTLEKGKALAQDGLETATDAVHAAYGAVKSEVQNPSDSDADLAKRAGDATAAAVQAVKASVSDPSSQT